MATINIGGFYLARVKQTFPQVKQVTRHVEVLREVDGQRWEVVETHDPKTRYVVKADQLQPESDAMRASREQSWRDFGRDT